LFSIPANLVWYKIPAYLVLIVRTSKLSREVCETHGFRYLELKGSCLSRRLSKDRRILEG